MSKKQRIGLYTIAPAIIFVLSFLMFYKEARLLGPSDMTAHMHYAMSLDLVTRVTHCGWHFVCWLFYACLPITIEVAAGASTAFFNTITAVLILWIMEYYLCDKTKSIVLPTVGTVASLLVGPLYLRFYNPGYYKGQGTPNAWHNPTSIAVRPYMLLISVLTVGYWNCGKEEKVVFGKRTMKKTTVYQWGLMILLLVSTITKPSYLMVYLPVCGIAALIKLIEGKGKNFVSLVCAHLYFVPSLIVFLWQYIKIFLLGGTKGNTEGGIEIAFFKVARLYAPSVTISLILKMAFPFLILILFWKVLVKDKLFPLVFGQFLTGLAITWTLSETGKRASHGNFGWSNILASSFFWIFCIIFFLKEYLENREKIKEDTKLKLKYGIPAVVLVWHLLAGVCYYVTLLLNMNTQL